MRILLLYVAMAGSLAVNSMAARHLDQSTREAAAHRILPPAPVEGERYSGNYRDGKYEGRGVLVYSNGEKYSGTFEAGVRSGRGIYTWPDGRRYVGEFSNGQPHGQGRYTLANGEEYTGTFRDNRREGQGVYTWPDLRRYVGAFHEDLPHGKGQLTLTGGQRQVGWFRNGAYAGEEEGSTPPVPLQIPASGQSGGAAEIKLARDGVNFAAPVLLNGAVQSQFLVDSGAADVLVPMSIFDDLLRAGTVSQADVTGFENYRMANGTSARAVTFLIRKLQVGDVVLDNVRGAAVDASAPPLLGMSFLGRFRSWALDNERETLVLTAYAR